MPSAKPNLLRKIAEQEIDACFCGMHPATRNELVTSLVRQLLTNDGFAVFVTREQEFGFQLSPLDDGGRQLGRHVNPGTFVALVRKSRIIEEQIPSLLHELNKCQCVRWRADYGQMLQIRVDPRERRFHIEYVLDEEN